MKSPLLSLPLLFLFLFSSVSASTPYSTTHEAFLQCLSLQIEDASESQLIFTPNNPLYSSVLNFSIQNLVFTEPGTPRPLVIITPLRESHAQAAVICSRNHGMELRVRSGGHDYEGLSYVAAVPFAILDLTNMRNVDVDVQSRTAWVQGGARLGEVYYYIANKTRTLGFPAGLCPSVGVGGHFSGGGYGLLLRKYGLAADHILDARLVDTNGRILNRRSMGEDVFWAIRGGGGGTFGIVLSFKIELVPVPANVTVFSLSRSLEQNATRLVHRWQYIADQADENLYLRIFIRGTNSSTGKKTVVTSFDSLYLGGTDTLVPMMDQIFPELGLRRENCTEMSWAQAVLFFAGGQVLEDLLNRTYPYNERFKLKSDYVTEPMSEQAFEGIWRRFKNEEVDVPVMVFSPYGGRMSQISPSAIPFPHRAGIRYGIVYQSGWGEAGEAARRRHLNWIRELYNYMTPYVSKNPRLAYINYRDLDIGMNNPFGNTSYAQASVWGIKYFEERNFKRLVRVKTVFDPQNFFSNEQSVPPLPSSSWIEGVNHHPHAGRDSQ